MIVGIPAIVAQVLDMSDAYLGLTQAVMGFGGLLGGLLAPLGGSPEWALRLLGGMLELTTGVTVRPWTGIFMLRNLSSPETYFQAAFRVQSPWEVTTEGGKKEIIKQECYVFDFALDRALKQISDYSCRLNIDEATQRRRWRSLSASCQ